MKHIQNHRMILALVLGAAAAGCAADPADGAGDDGTGDGGGDGNELLPVDAVGTYRLQSNFDLAASVPGTAGEVVHKIIEITDGADDPMRWVLDQVIAAMPSGVVKTALQGATPYVAGYLNNLVLDLAPDFVPVVVELANNFGQLAQGFGVNQTLEVSGAPGAYTSKVTVVGAHFTIDGTEADAAFADHGAAEVVAEPVGVTLGTGKLGIAEHRFALSYGKVLRIGLDAAIVPMLEPGANSLHALFASKVSCKLVGQAIAAAIGFGAGTAEAACTSGLNRAADFLYSKIEAIGGTGLEFGISGAARAIDKDRDGSVDTLNTGEWTGTLSFGGTTPQPLAGATFFGARM